MPPASRGAAIFMFAYGAVVLLVGLSLSGDTELGIPLIAGAILVLLGANYMRIGRDDLAGALLIAGPVFSVIVLGLLGGAGDLELWMYLILSGLFLGFPPLFMGLYLLARSR